MENLLLTVRWFLKDSNWLNQINLRTSDNTRDSSKCLLCTGCREGQAKRGYCVVRRLPDMANRRKYEEHFGFVSGVWLESCTVGFALAIFLLSGYHAVASIVSFRVISCRVMPCRTRGRELCGIVNSQFFFIFMLQQVSCCCLKIKNRPDLSTIARGKKKCHHFFQFFMYLHMSVDSRGAG